MSAHVVGLLVAPVKGLRIAAPDEVFVDLDGVPENRRFLLVDERDRMVNGKMLGSLHEVLVDYSHAERTLALHFPDGETVTGHVRDGAPRTAALFSRSVEAFEVPGPWSAALSRHVGRPVRLLESAGGRGAVDRGAGGTVSLISRATLARLTDELALDEPIDPRRFRMLFEIDGVGPHEEDAWLGKPLRIGEAVVRLHGHVGRCAVTQRDPETGRTDIQTLKGLAGYREHASTTEPLACGVYGFVLSAGSVRVGDTAALL